MGFRPACGRAISTRPSASGRGLKAGTIEVNTYMAGTPELPLTGHKESGSGHERGRFAVDEFTELKTIHLQLN